jgi:hypothetical protein
LIAGRNPTLDDFSSDGKLIQLPMMLSHVHLARLRCID